MAINDYAIYNVIVQCAKNCSDEMKSVGYDNIPEHTKIVDKWHRKVEAHLSRIEFMVEIGRVNGVIRPKHG